MIHFEGSMPDFIENRGGTTQITTEQFKEGTQCLKWNYKEGAQLRFHVPIGYGPVADGAVNNKRYGFAIYLFGQGMKTPGWMTVTFCKGARVCCQFDILLGFSGWRSVSAGFDRDMEGLPESGMDNMTITAHGGEGTLLLDEIVTAERMDYRHIMASYQTPGFRVKLAPIVQDWRLKPEYCGGPFCADDFGHIAEAMMNYIVAEFRTPEKLGSLLDQVAALHIREGSLGLAGERIEYSGQRRQVGRPAGSRGACHDLGEVTKLLRSLAVCCRVEQDEDAERAYLQVLRFLITQGFAEGSTLGHHAILDYALRPLYHSVFLMKESILASGLAADVRGAMRWFLHMGSRGFLKGQPRDWATADDFNNIAQGMLAAILLEEDQQACADWLMALRGWLSDNMMFTDGLRDLFKEDGCIYHHAGHYLAYGQGAVEGVAPVVYALSGTAFDLPEEAWQNMKYILKNMRFQCNTLDYPIALCGRHPLGTWKLSLTPYKYFALSALARRDDEMVRVYLRLMGRPKNQTDHILSAFARPEETPQGNRSYPYACANVHRHGDWMVVTKGFSKYLWGSEIYMGNNLYGRYRSYGVVELVPGGGVEAGGFSHDGYDWNHFPGATNIVLPWEQLRAQVHNVDEYSGFEEMLLGASAFAGSVSLDGCGMFSMILMGHPKYNASFHARKSVFLVGDFILLLGSGIENNSVFETETTLYQNAILSGDMPPQVGGQMITGDMTMDGKTVLEDNRGHKYYLPDGTKIRLRSGMQRSMSSTGEGKTEGAFALGSILHGVSPQDGSYEYGIGIGGAQALPYQVLRRDAQAHAALVGDMLCVSLFEPGEAVGVEADAPVLVMIRQNGESVRLAVCNPDLGLYDEDPSQYDENGVRREVSVYSRDWLENPVAECTVHLRLPGRYQGSCDGARIEADGERTRIALDTKGGSVYTLELARV